MYELLGICLVLTALLAMNAFASLIATGLWRVCEKCLRNFSAHTRAEILFALRISPPAAALIFVGLLIIPAYVGYEPHETTEIVSAKLAGLALVSVSGLAFAMWRVCRSIYATQALLRVWLRHGRPIKIDGIEIPTFQIRHSFPIIAVVGTLKPRLFVAARVLQAVNQEELSAAIAHERGHLLAQDNLKRSILRACRDALVVFPFGRPLDQAWAEAAESAADEHAAKENADTALNLASALVKIARMIPTGQRVDVPVAAYLVAVEDNQGVKKRVNRLMEIASGDFSRTDSSLPRIAAVVSLVCFVILAAAVANDPRLLVAVHAAIERAVNLLC